MIFLIILYISIFVSGMFAHEIRTNITRDEPVYISKMPLSKYTLFATGGWDGNWYVGYNQCWIEKLKITLTKEDFSKAFIGAKLGRMKSQQKPKKPSWIREAFPGEVYIAVSSTPYWKPNSYRLLTKTHDIPLQYDYENAIEEVGEARWFWTEVPIDNLNFNGDNYVILWSPNEYITSVASAPILAAAWGDREVDSWLNTDINGWPHTLKSDVLKTPITIFEPAIAIKLVPVNSHQEINVRLSSVKELPQRRGVKVIHASISGDEIERAYLEVSNDGRKWEKVSRTLYAPPYIFTLDPENLPYGRIFVRITAVDVWENSNSSKPIEMMVTKEETKSQDRR